LPILEDARIRRQPVRARLRAMAFPLVASTLGVPAAFATTVEADRLREVLAR